MLAARHVGGHAIAVKLQLGKLELGVLVIKEDRGVMEIFGGALGMGSYPQRRT
jgi:hypothetical protein